MHSLKKSALQLLFFSSIVFFVQSSAVSQEWPYRIDSLEAHVREGQTDSLLYHTLYALAQIKAKMNTDSAVAYAWQLIALADEMREPPRQIRSRRVLGEVYYHAGMADSVEQATLRAITQGDNCQTEGCFFEKMHAIKLLRLPLRQRGQVKEIIRWWETFLQTPNLPHSIEFEVRRLMSYPLLEMGEQDQALRELIQVWEYGKEVGDEVLLCNGLGELSGVYFELGQTEKALEVAYERLRVCQGLERRPAIIHTYTQIGQTLLQLERYDSAYVIYLQLLKMVKENDFDYPYVLLGLMESAYASGRTEADQYLQRAEILLANKEVTHDQNVHSRQFLYGALSRHYLSTGNFARAQLLARKRLNWLRRFQSDTTELSLDAFELLAETQAAKGDHAGALQSYRQFHQIKMALVKRNQQDALAKAVVEMDLAENKLARREAEQATLLEQQTSQVRTRFFLMLLGLVGLILAVVLWSYRRTQKAKQLVSEKNEQIERSLAEKEVLLREIHHRVKNNLQIISSLLDKQARKSSDQAVRKLVREGQERIQSMALIHQNLYESEQLSGIDIKSYLQELSENIQRSQAMGIDKVELELDVAEEKLDIDTAIPVGLILNELLTNCYKYAFNEQERGRICIRFSKTQDACFLEVRDDGIGYLPSENPSKERTLGLSLVNGLVRQLRGTIEWLVVERGTAIAIKF